MTTNEAQTLSAASNTITLPTGYMGTRRFEFVSPSRQRVAIESAEAVERSMSFTSAGAVSTGTPDMAHDDNGTSLVFNRKADVELTARWTYYAIPTALSASNNTNFLTTYFPTLLREACLKFAYQYRKDTVRANDSEVKAMAAIELAHQSDALRIMNSEMGSYVVE